MSVHRLGDFRIPGPQKGAIQAPKYRFERHFGCYLAAILEEILDVVIISENHPNADI